MLGGIYRLPCIAESLHELAFEAGANWCLLAKEGLEPGRSSRPRLQAVWIGSRGMSCRKLFELSSMLWSGFSSNWPQVGVDCFGGPRSARANGAHWRWQRLEQCLGSRMVLWKWWEASQGAVGWKARWDGLKGLGVSRHAGLGWTGLGWAGIGWAEMG